MYTAVEHIVAKLQEEIVMGQLSHGSGLPLRELAKRFQTSPIPVREALRTLGAMGLVELRPHRPAVVAHLSFEELEDVYNARILIEPVILQSVAAPLSAPEAERLLAHVERMTAALGSGDYVSAFSEHRGIHFGLLRVGGSPALTNILAGLWQASERYRAAILPSRGDPNSVAEEHRRIIHSLRSGELEVASIQLREHLGRSLDVLRTAGIGPREGARVSETSTSQASAMKTGEPGMEESVEPAIGGTLDDQ